MWATVYHLCDHGCCPYSLYVPTSPDPQGLVTTVVIILVTLSRSRRLHPLRSQLIALNLNLPFFFSGPFHAHTPICTRLQRMQSSTAPLRHNTVL